MAGDQRILGRRRIGFAGLVGLLSHVVAAYTGSDCISIGKQDRHRSRQDVVTLKARHDAVQGGPKNPEVFMIINAAIPSTQQATGIVCA